MKDVAIKKRSGTASMGLDRYYVLIDGPTSDAADDLILEFKQSRRSALYGLVPAYQNSENGGNGENGDNKEKDEKAARIVQSQDIHLAGGDPYFGHVAIDDQSFLVRERSPFKDDIDVDDLDSDALGEYAAICGQSLAQTHARSDEGLYSLMQTGVGALRCGLPSMYYIIGVTQPSRFDAPKIRLRNRRFA